MKGWRICSTRADCMNGDYLNVDLHTRYFHNAKEVLRLISPDHYDKFAANLTQRLKELQAQENDEVCFFKRFIPIFSTSIDLSTVFVANFQFRPEFSGQ